MTRLAIELTQLLERGRGPVIPTDDATKAETSSLVRELVLGKGETAMAQSQLTTLEDGRQFPTYNGDTLSWCISSTLSDEQEGFPRLRAVVRAMRDYRPEQLQRERHEELKATFNQMFGHNARKVLRVIDEVLSER
jgi:hypothetical protein